MALTNNQKKFCQEYVKSGNGTQAYKKVYKTCKKEETAMTNSSRMLRNANVQEYIKELQSKIEDKAIMSIKERMEWLSRVVRGEEKSTSFDMIGNEHQNEPKIDEKIKAVDTLNKMDGVYVTKVQDMTPPVINIERPKDD